ncbi:DUF2188 domain-containing protein [Lacticaseibacillus daqingensis]|uniref:hypothetical protein n=1 Tax=Lacticaseibacillus daqingensis TaxID=2486014 RepID=UPI000F79821C|nr:hypothetical protein [Lacticaseibacillus daqingensis]
MTWTLTHCPTPLTQTRQLVRKKTLEIANDLRRENVPDHLALALALRQARQWYQAADASTRAAYARH